MNVIYSVIQNGEVLAVAEFLPGVNIATPAENTILTGTPADVCIKCSELEVKTEVLDNYITAVFS